MLTIIFQWSINVETAGECKEIINLMYNLTSQKQIDSIDLFLTRKVTKHGKKTLLEINVLLLFMKYAFDFTFDAVLKQNLKKRMKIWSLLSSMPLVPDICRELISKIIWIKYSVSF